MKLPYPVLTDLQDAERNFDAIQQQRIYTGNHAPAFTPTEPVAYYFRFDTPGVSMQRIYIFNGSAWTGIV